MNSPQAYIQQLILNFTNNWLENFDESSLKIGLWNGEVNLTDLLFRKQVFDISEELQFSLEYGHLQNCQLHIPWSKLRSGGISIEADDICLVLRMHQTIDNLKSTSSGNVKVK